MAAQFIPSLAQPEDPRVVLGLRLRRDASTLRLGVRSARSARSETIMAMIPAGAMIALCAVASIVTANSRPLVLALGLGGSLALASLVVERLNARARRAHADILVIDTKSGLIEAPERGLRIPRERVRMVVDLSVRISLASEGNSQRHDLMLVLANERTQQDDWVLLSSSPWFNYASVLRALAREARLPVATTSIQLPPPVAVDALCPACRYDLQGLPAGAPCPECGHLLPRAPRPATLP